LREHLTYFDAATLGRLLEDAGFHVLEARSCVRYFPLSHLVGRLRQLGLPAGSLGEALGRRVVGAPAGEMRVVARRGG
jgi:hypothetical protein